jgi:site-specific DNA-cytosine methylase
MPISDTNTADERRMRTRYNSDLRIRLVANMISTAHYPRCGVIEIGEYEDCNVRIRKLTPRECFRLMGVYDTDIDKMQASGLSNSAQYKLAGNSIVVDVLYHLFRKMFIETDQETQQLTLF